MKRKTVYMGDTPLKINEAPVTGAFTELDGERFYKISNADRMPDFFLSIVSATDQWMFISSNGSLSAGRKNPEGALFPYYSEDKIHDFKDKTGGRTLILADAGGRVQLWEPFTGTGSGVWPVRRNIYKNLMGNKLVFEEINPGLGLTFRYGWYNSKRFGFVKRSTLLNHGAGPVRAEVLDGLLNILPGGVDPGLQLTSSNLLDAYKRAELVRGTSLAVYRLSSVPSDTAEPSESLRVNTVWSEGLPEGTILLSGRQLELFRSGYPVEAEHDIKASKGAYFVRSALEIQAGGQQQWSIIAEVNQDSATVAGLVRLLESGEAPGQSLLDDIGYSSDELVSLVAASDALQCTADELSTTRHLSNVLFNIMRGGIFAENYTVQADDFMAFVSRAHKGYVEQANELVAGYGKQIPYDRLKKAAGSGGHPNLFRLCLEYLPLTFSRRHGDPSRPWNRFSIDNRNEDGSRKLDYQGNWRDIFQNWEALGYSYPGFVESMISKFVNASTADGYNPYRITRNGIDWEVPDPLDPWSNIGYWGDHQVIYLLKFLELSRDHHPGELQELLSMDLFSYANVPYRIRPYGELLEDPRNTIRFDEQLQEMIMARVEAVGSDGKLVWDRQGEVLLVNLAEKLMVMLLVKLSNLIPGAGIWMNTQRPEWNDANNALVGYGVSMVTACYLRAFILFCRELFGSATRAEYRFSDEVAQFFSRVNEVLAGQLLQVEKMLTQKGMKACMDLLGTAGSDYRQVVYQEGFSGKRTGVKSEQINEFCDTALQVLDHTILSGRRDDGLYHAYNLIRVEGDRLFLRRLYEMLEGQVAVLGSGFLKIEEAADLLDALRESELFRKDQYSYILYPDRDLPAFLEKNNIPAGELQRSELLQGLIRQADRRIVIEDINGVCHFHASFKNAGLLNRALDALPEEYSELVQKERGVILEIYEKLFDHQSFTGRSGTFYGYEGLGSIYWHMVSKLLLAVCETIYRADEKGVSREMLDRMAVHYYEIRAGIGLNKEPDVYGAFPTDPYSHTPGNRGAQQPGMTGQVKEDIISRWGELGLVIREGTIRFRPLLLRRSEFRTRPAKFDFLDVAGAGKSLILENNSLAFTYCQVPVIYHLSDKRKILLHFNDGSELPITGDTIEQPESAGIFSRSGAIVLVDVWLPPGIQD
jgi:hypothetical protein